MPINASQFLSLNFIFIQNMKSIKKENIHIFMFFNKVSINNILLRKKVYC